MSPTSALQNGTINFGTIFSGCDGLAACIHDNPELFGDYRQLFCAELVPNLSGRHNADIIGNALAACSVLAARCLSRGVVNLGDVTQADWSEKARERNLAHERVHLVVGGPPCPPYSSSGTGAGRMHKFGWLSHEFGAFMGRCRPDVIVFENVAGLTRTQHEPYFNEIKAWLGEMGYAVDHGFLYPDMNFGEPVSRARVFIIGVLGELSGSRRVEEIFSAWPERRRYDSNRVRWADYVETESHYRERMQSSGHETSLAELVLKPEEAATSMRTKAGRSRLSANLSTDVRELFERVESGSRPSGQVSERIVPRFWGSEHSLKDSTKLGAIMKGGWGRVGTFVEIGGRLWPRKLTAWEAEKFQSYSGEWTDCEHSARRPGHLTEEERFALMGNSFNLTCIKFILEQIDRVMRPIWQR